MNHWHLFQKRYELVVLHFHCWWHSSHWITLNYLRSMNTHTYTYTFTFTNTRTHTDTKLHIHTSSYINCHIKRFIIDSTVYINAIYHKLLISPVAYISSFGANGFSVPWPTPSDYFRRLSTWCNQTTERYIFPATYGALRVRNDLCSVSICNIWTWIYKLYTFMCQR